jgi:hypothetical protein
MTVNKDMDIAARDLEWEGCDNVRDRGGLPTTGGGKTAPRRIVRANNLDYSPGTAGRRCGTSVCAPWSTCAMRRSVGPTSCGLRG